MRRAATPELSDDLPLEPLLQGIADEIPVLEKNPSQTFVFGDRVIPKRIYIDGLKRFIELGKTSPSKVDFLSAVKKEFDFYEVYGDPDWGSVFLTSYYEPIIPGSLKPTAGFTQPIYRAPQDLISLDLALFDDKYNQDRKLRGRLKGSALVPYYSREEIDTRQALKGRKLELCYVDPIDAYALQVQGSATVDLGGGKQLRLAYAEKNGARYEAVGKFVKDKIPPDQLNWHTIEAHLRSLPREEAQALLNKNPSYVFFQPTGITATTYLGTSAVDGRTIATDKRYFLKGAIAFLSTTQPVFDGQESMTPKAWEKLERFVLDQDIGGAIQGGGRVDLFWGRGNEAKRYAGVMKQTGRLYYLLPKW